MPPPEAGLGYIAVGIILGIVMTYITMEIAKFLGRRSQKSQLNEKDDDIDDLESEVERLRAEVRKLKKDRHSHVKRKEAKE